MNFTNFYPPSVWLGRPTIGVNQRARRVSGIQYYIKFYTHAISTEADAEEEDTWVRIGGARFPEEYMPPQDVVDQIVPPCINYFCATLRMFNDRFFRFFFGVRNEHALTVEEDSSLVGIPAEECPYTEDEIEAFKEW